MAEFYCVETKKVFSAPELTRVHNHAFPNTLGYTWEKVDYEHQNTHAITSYILNSVVFATIGLAFVSLGWASDYFHGENVCPTIGLGRSILAHLDMNVFYYYKEFIATSCEVEDSFWRLLMDGWYRGVVTSSDSWLMLVMTLPKAWLFKTTITSLAQPVLGFIYGVIGVVLDRLVFFGITEAHAVQSLWKQHVEGTKKLAEEHPVTKATAPVTTFFSRIYNFLTISTYNWVQDQRKAYLTMFSQLFEALYYAGLFRMVWRYLVETYVPILAFALASCTMRELAMEVLAYYVLSTLCKRLDKSLDGIFPKAAKAASGGGPVLTLASDQYSLAADRSWPARYAYFKGRLERLYTSYKADAGALASYVETLFEGVVAFRLFVIVVSPWFNISGLLRSIMRMFLLGGILDHQAETFVNGTGSTGEPGMYMSERWADWAVVQLFGGAMSALSIGKQVTIGETYHVSTFVLHIYEAFWRALLPVVFYHLEKKHAAFHAAKEAAFAAKWKNPEGGEGSFKEWCAKNGCPNWVEETPVVEEKKEEESPKEEPKAEPKEEEKEEKKDAKKSGKKK